MQHTSKQKKQWLTSNIYDQTPTKIIPIDKSSEEKQKQEDELTPKKSVKQNSWIRSHLRQKRNNSDSLTLNDDELTPDEKPEKYESSHSGDETNEDEEDMVRNRQQEKLQLQT